MTPPAPRGATLTWVDDATLHLVRLSAVLASGTEDRVRSALQAAQAIPHEWVEELLLQTYLFAGFPRALNGMREWRRHVPAPPPSPPTGDVRALGEATCATVYGGMYERLRRNIRGLHPLLDDWMIEEGYGKVLSRPGLDLPRRELCIMAACAATAQDRQLQSHLHGARNAGVSEPAVSQALDALRDVLPAALHARAVHMWDRVRHDVH